MASGNSPFPQTQRKRFIQKMPKNVNTQNASFECWISYLLNGTKSQQEIINELDKKINDYQLYIKIRLEDRRDNIKYLFDNNQIKEAKEETENLLKWMNTFPSSFYFSHFKKGAA